MNNSGRFILSLLLCVPLLYSCTREPVFVEDIGEHTVHTVHYRCTAHEDISTKATVTGEFGSYQYVFEDGDRLYVNYTDDKSDSDPSNDEIKMYGFLNLISGAGATEALFEGDLYCIDGFTPVASTPLSACLVSTNDVLHTVEQGKITSTVYPTDEYALTFSEAIQKYSDFTDDSGSFGDSSFSLSQQSAFLYFTIAVRPDADYQNTTLTAKITDSSVDIWSADIDVAAGVRRFEFIVPFDGGTTLSADAEVSIKKDETTHQEFSINPATLAANTYYKISRSTYPGWGGFKITATQDDTRITFNYADADDNFWYSTDDGVSWTRYKTSDGYIVINDEDELCLKGERASERNYFKNKISESGSGDNWTINYTQLFSSSGNKLCYISGDMRSLLYGDSFTSETSIPASAFSGCFCKANWVDIKPEQTGSLLLAQSIGDYCFEDMFHGCTTLHYAPDFPNATSYGQYCCRGMLRKCTELKTAPSVSYNVTTTVTVSLGSFMNMCRLCSKLETVTPYLPAPVMAQNCYREMFRQCTSIEHVNSGMLPAMTLAESCYQQIFNGCSKLTDSPNLPATTLAPSCYDSMFSACIKLTSAPILRAPSLVTKCYRQMFHNCKSLKTIICLATSITPANSRENWVVSIGSDVAGTGTFYRSPDIDDATWGTGASAIPSGWDIVPYSGD